MKKYFIIGTALMCALVAYDAYAANVNCMSSSCGNSGYTEIDLVSNCASKTSICYGNNKYYSCTTCLSGYTRTAMSTGPMMGCSNTGTYYTCKINCTGCSDCTSDASWSAIGNGYQRKTTRTCNCNTCIETHSYQCGPGYYGSSSNGTSGCERCPGSKAGGAGDGEPWGYSIAGATSITQCYIEAWMEICDDTGCFDFTDDCYWTN